MKKWQVQTWTTVQPGSIYHAVSQLEKQGFLKHTNHTESKKLGPAKSEYTITAAGEREFLSLLKASLLSFNIEQQSAGIAFMEFLTREEVVSLLLKRSDELRKVPKFLATLPVSNTPNEPSEHPELVNTWTAYLNDIANNTDQMKNRIQSGAYKFKGE
jgi:DNA-binding PadR family transcriptional regulator